MKAAAVVIETEGEREARRERGRESDNLLAELESVRHKGARWDTTQEMLGQFFALYGRMESAPAIDPAREVIQGLRVDRDERIIWQARIKQVLTQVAWQQGNDRGVLLLWMHFRPPSQTGEVRDADGRKRQVYGQHSLAIRDLHTEAGGSRDGTVRDFWRAFQLVEDAALAKGWVRYRRERPAKENIVRAYRRRG